MSKCEICGKEAELKEYKIVDSLGTRYRNLCTDCAKTLEGSESAANSCNSNPTGQSNHPIQTIGNQQKADPQKCSFALYVAGVLFLIASVILYTVSVNNDYGVANIQSTVFAAACFVAAIICCTGGTVIKALKKD